MSMTKTSAVSRRELLIFFYKYRARLLVAFLIPFVLTLIVSTMPVPLYKAESVLVVRLGSEYVYQPEVNSAQASATIPFDREQIFKSEVAILGSDDLHREVIKAIGIEKVYPEIIEPSTMSRVRHFIMGGFLNMLDAKQKTPEDLEQYRLAIAVNNFDKHFDILLEKESAVINVTIEHKDRAIAINMLETLLKLYFEKRKQLYLEPRAELAESQAAASRVQLQEAQKAVESFKRDHQIYSLDDQRKQLLEKRSDAERRALSINSASLNKEIAGYVSDLDALDAQEREFLALQKDEQLASDNYAAASRRFEEAKAFEDVQRERSSSVRIIQPPSTPPEPKKMRFMIILAGSVLSLLITLITAAICETSRRGFLTPEEAERQLKLPVLAVLPLL